MDGDPMKRALALAVAYLAIGTGSALIVHGVTDLPAPTNPYPNVNLVRVTPDPSPWIQRYAGLVALAAHNAYELERKDHG